MRISAAANAILSRPSSRETHLEPDIVTRFGQHLVDQ